MNREIHVRFCESLGVRFPWATLLVCPEPTLDEKGEYSSVGCFVEDGGGPSDVGVQAQASNRHELLG